jgi:hypothetical protein
MAIPMGIFYATLVAWLKGQSIGRRVFRDRG